MESKNTAWLPTHRKASGKFGCFFARAAQSCRVENAERGRTAGGKELKAGFPN